MKNMFLAHFQVKSKEEFFLRKKGRNVFYKFNDNTSNQIEELEKGFASRDYNDVEDERVYNYYLKNLNTPTRNNIADCLLSAAEVLNNNDINMEEYLSAFYILCAGHNLLSKESLEEVNILLIKAFNIVMQKDMKIYEAELFIIDVPFLLQSGMNRDIVLTVAKRFYDRLGQTFLANQSYMNAALLRTNKKWLDIL